MKFPIVIDTANPETFPKLTDFVEILNNFDARLSALESAPMSAQAGVPFGAADRAMLDEVAAFFGVHRVVANTVDTRANNPEAQIDPLTGLPVVVQEKPTQVLQSTGFSSGGAQQMPGA